MANTQSFFVRNLVVGTSTTFQVNSTANVVTIAANLALGSITANGTNINVGIVSITNTQVKTTAATMNATAVSVGSNCYMTSTQLRVGGGVDGSVAQFAGITRGVRIFTDASYGRVEALDNTLSTYQPMLIGGSYNYIATNGTARIYMDGSGNVGIGTGPSDTFHVAGNIVASGDITTSYSDIRLKDHLYDLENVLEKLKTLKAFAYVPSATLLKHDPDQSASIKFGLSAQDIKRVFPEIVSLAPFDRDTDGTSKTGEEYLTLDYVRLVPILLAAINELGEKIDCMEKELNTLKDKK